MPDSTITIDGLEAFQVTLQFAAKIALDQHLVARDRLDNFVDLMRGEVPGAQVWIDIRLLQDAFCSARSNSVNVGQRSLDPFVRWNLYSK